MLSIQLRLTPQGRIHRIGHITVKKTHTLEVKDTAVTTVMTDRHRVKTGEKATLCILEATSVGEVQLVTKALVRLSGVNRGRLWAAKFFREGAIVSHIQL